MQNKTTSLKKQQQQQQQTLLLHDQCDKQTNKQGEKLMMNRTVKAIRKIKWLYSFFRLFQFTFEFEYTNRQYSIYVFR